GESDSRHHEHDAEAQSRYRKSAALSVHDRRAVYPNTQRAEGSVRAALEKPRGQLALAFDLDHSARNANAVVGDKADGRPGDLESVHVPQRFVPVQVPESDSTRDHRAQPIDSSVI